MNKAAGIQHIPQFLLRNFCGPRKSRCFVFDKATARVFESNIRNVGGEHSFYDFEIGGVTLSVDPILSALEDAAAPVVQKIIRSESLHDVSADERAAIAQFAAAQLVRCRHTRVRFEDLSEAIEEELRSRGLDPLRVSGLSPLTARDAKFLAIQAVLESDEIVPHLYSKDWVLFRCQNKPSFMISDNPVARQNLRRGEGLGVASLGIEIYLPVSSNLTVVFLCRNLSSYCREAIRQYEEWSRQGRQKPEADLSALLELLHSIESGEPLDCNAENVININSLQVKFSERFLFSSDSDFSLAREMLASGRYRKGPRLRVK